MKKILLVIGVLVAVVATTPWWGGCDINYKRCTAWCTLRHLDSDAKAAGCKARCAGDKASCIADEGAEAVSDFINGLSGD